METTTTKSQSGGFTRRKICIPISGVNIYDPMEVLQVHDSNKIKSFPDDVLARYYLVKKISVDKSCPTGISYELLFLSDILEGLPASYENLEMIKEMFSNSVPEKYILHFWSKNPNLDSDWKSLKNKTNYKNTVIPRLVFSKDYQNWYQDKRDFFKIKPLPVTSRRVIDMEVNVRLKSKKEKILNFTNEGIFASLVVSQDLPYISCQNLVKYHNSSIISNTWKTANTDFWAIVAVEESIVPPITKLKMFSGQGKDKLLLIVKIQDWVNSKKDDISFYLNSHNIESSKLKDIEDAIETWKLYRKSFNRVSIYPERDTILVKTQIRSGDFELVEKMRKSLFRNKFEIVDVNPGHVKAMLIYEGIALDINIFSDLVFNQSTLCRLLVVHDERKTTHIMSVGKELKGSFRVSVKIFDETVKATVIQKPGDKKSMNIPYLEVNIEAFSMSAIDKFSGIFGRALAIYSKDASKLHQIYSANIPSYPSLPKIGGIPCEGKKCSNDIDCVKKKGCGPCNPVSNKCSRGINTTEWWIENYSRNCQKDYAPWLVDPSTVSALRKRGYMVEEFPKNSGQYLTCSIQSNIKKGKKLKNLYLLQSKLKNNTEFPFVPCCGAEDNRGNPGEAYNKYYRNLENLNLGNGTKIELTFPVFSMNDLKSVMDYALKQNLVFIDVDPESNRFLQHEMNIPSGFSLKPQKNPIGAVSLSRGSDGLTKFTIFVESDLVRDERDAATSLLGVKAFTASLSNPPSIKTEIDSVKQNEDLKKQKRAAAGREGKPPENIYRFLRLSSLYYDECLTWKRRGVVRNSSATFLHILHCVTNGKKISQESDFSVRKNFKDRCEDIGMAECFSLTKQSMYGLDTEEIYSKLDPNSREYFDPRQFHALASYVYSLNIVLISRERGSEKAEFVLPYHSEFYVPTVFDFKDTVIVYEHFGTQAEKYLKFPHCELIYCSSSAILTKNFALKTWKKVSENFVGSKQVTCKKIPEIFLTEGWSQIINEKGKGIAFCFEDMRFDTEALPSLPVPMREDLVNIKNFDQISKFLIANGAILISNEESDYKKAVWQIEEFKFSTLVYPGVVTLPYRANFLSNRFKAKCLQGYFNFAFSLYLEQIDFNDDNLYMSILNMQGKEPEKDLAYTMDCTRQKIIEMFVKKFTSKKVNLNVTEQDLSSRLPPPETIYKKGVLYLNSALFMKQEDYEDIISRLSLHCYLLLRDNLGKILKFSKFNTILDFYSEIIDFPIRENQIISYRNIHESSTSNEVYQLPLVNQNIDYLWSSKLTGGKIVFSRTFNSSDKSKLEDWLNSLDPHLAEEIPVFHEETDIIEALDSKDYFLLIFGDTILLCKPYH